MSDILSLVGKVEPNMKKPMEGVLWYFSFLCCFLRFNGRYALTVAMLGTHTIYKLLAAENKPVPVLGLLDFQFLVKRPLWN